MKRLKRGRKSSKSVDWVSAPDIAERSLKLITELKMDWILYERLFFYRSNYSKARAYARTWGLPALWQRSLGVEPGYIIEVLSEYFDKLDERNQDKVILHELTHIPHNFSGALVPHTGHKKGSFHHKLEELVDQYFRNLSEK
ncbi:MAG TPA: putative metallopeptidase [Patescibacteria group bacterium]|nr:putative metallopeptidase [Patescibacteria group bacterium]